MVFYFITSIILAIIFEYIGRCFLYLIGYKNETSCSFGVGIIVFLAYSYISTSLLFAINCPFYIPVVIYSLFFCVFTFLLVKYRKHINFKLNIKYIFIILLFSIVMIYYTYNTTLGDLGFYDSTFYLNIVTSNIKSPALNTTINDYGNTYSTISYLYSFQTYYLVASYISFIVTPLIKIFTNTYYVLSYIWIFQFLFNMFFCSLIIQSIKALKIEKHYILGILFFVFFLLFYGRTDTLNATGFFGNAYRFITTGYTILFLYKLFNETKFENWLLFIISLLSNAAVSSTGLFVDIFIMFGAFFILVSKDVNTLKYYSLCLLFILTDLFTVLLSYNACICLIFSFLICAVLFIFSKQLYILFNKKNVSLITVMLIFVILCLLSNRISNNIFDFSYFLNSNNPDVDQIFNYFNIFSIKKYTFIKLFILIIMIYSLIFKCKQDIIKFILILIICLFNPFCAPILNKVILVFTRSYDIIINPFTIVLFCSYLMDVNKYLYYILCLCLLVLSIINPINAPVYSNNTYEPGYNYHFSKKNDYNGEFKMQNDEVEIINCLRDEIDYYHIEHPYIVTSNLLTQSFIPQGRYVYNRYNLRNNPFDDIDQSKIYYMFYPQQFFGEEYISDYSEYNNIPNYVNNAGIDYIVMNKDREYYDINSQNYSYLYFKLQEYFDPIYENNTYMLFKCINK